MLGAYFGYTGGIPFSKSLEWNSDNNNGNDPGNDNSSGDLKGKRSLRTQDINPRGLDFPLNNSENRTWQDTFTGWTTTLINKVKTPFNWFRSNPEETVDSNDYQIWKKQEEEGIKKWEQNLKLLEKEESKRDQLLELERDQLRKEYLESRDKNKTSPTHPDPEIAKDYGHLFQYIVNREKEKEKYKPFTDLFIDKFDKKLEEVKDKGKQMADLFIEKTLRENQVENTIIEEILKGSQIETPAESSNSRDSSETVRPLIKDTPPVTSSESNSEVEHTYPPQPWTTVVRRKPVRFSILAKTPFAKGFIEKLDTSKPPVDSPDSKSSPSIEVEKGSVMFSARFADNFPDEWKD